MIAAHDFSVVDQKVPPHDLRLEEAVIGGILVDPNAIARIADLLLPESFYVSSNQFIYEAALELYKQSLPVTLMTVLTELHKKNQLNNVGGQKRLGQLVDMTPHAVNIDYYAKNLKELHLRRQLIESAHEQALSAYDTMNKVDELLDQSEQKLYSLSNNLRAASRSVEHVSVSCDRVITKIQQGEDPGLMTGFYDFDDLTKGLMPGHLMIAAGATGMGKTHFAIAMTYAIASMYNLPVVFFTCEMPTDEVTTRLLARISGIDSDKLLSRKVSPEDWNALGNAHSELASLPIHIFSHNSPNPLEIRSVLRRVAGDGQIGLVVLDYLQLLGEGSDNRSRELDVISRACKGIAIDFNTTFLALAQINRGVETRSNKRPVLGDLRESGGLEQNSDRIVFLYRDEYYYPESPDEGIAELILAKNRHGRMGTAKMLFDPRFSLFRNLARRNNSDEMRVARSPAKSKRSRNADKRQKAEVSPEMHEEASVSPDETWAEESSVEQSNAWGF